ncbi:MAG: hypothetical protein R3F19_12020 [Verrucomicrobiales bacterium]
MGVNLPATHVVVRDLMQGFGQVGIDTLVQMSGRAGRGKNDGHALFVLKQSDAWKLPELESALLSPQPPAVQSQLVPASDRSGWRSRGDHSAPLALAEVLLSLVTRRSESGMTMDEMEEFMSGTLAGSVQRESIGSALTWLANPMQVLAFGQHLETNRAPKANVDSGFAWICRSQPDWPICSVTS